MVNHADGAASFHPLALEHVQMRINDVLSGALTAAFALIIFLGAQGFPAIPGQNVGPKVFPQLIAAGLMVCAVLLVRRGLRTRAAEKWLTLPEWATHGRTVVGFLMVPLSLAFYVAASDVLGFIPTACLLLLGLFIMFDVRWRTALIVAVLGTLVIHALFYKMLKVPLPWGILSPYAW
jgi:putative tricarboxylic transport membrane protein